MRFVKLKDFKGDPIIVNIDNISYFEQINYPGEDEDKILLHIAVVIDGRDVARFESWEEAENLIRLAGVVK